MTGIPEYNKAEFDNAARWLRESGLSVFNPADMDMASGFDATGTTGFESKEELAKLGFSLRKALAADLKFIAEEAEELYVLPGYENSKGVAAEIALAQALKLPIWHLRKNPDGSYYRKDAPTGIGPRKLDGIEYKPGTYEGTVSPIDQSAVDKGLLPNESLVPPLTEAELTKALMDLQKSNAAFYGTDPQSASEKGDHTNYKNNGEVRTTSATGGQKGTKPERYDLIPVAPLAHLARTYGFGAEKYDDNNWQKGYDWKLSYAALQRHLNAFWGGEDFDPEIGTPHLANAAWHCFTLMWFMENKPEYDSRATSV